MLRYTVKHIYSHALCKFYAILLYIFAFETILLWSPSTKKSCTTYTPSTRRYIYDLEMIKKAKNPKALIATSNQ